MCGTDLVRYWLLIAGVAAAHCLGALICRAPLRLLAERPVLVKPRTELPLDAAYSRAALIGRCRDGPCAESASEPPCGRVKPANQRCRWTVRLPGCGRSQWPEFTRLVVSFAETSSADPAPVDGLRFATFQAEIADAELHRVRNRAAGAQPLRTIGALDAALVDEGPPPLMMRRQFIAHADETVTVAEHTARKR